MVKNQKSLFCAFEGLDGSGTTTHSRLLTGFLAYKKYKVYLTHEPTNSEIGLLLRDFLKNNKIPAATDALLFAADRVLHYQNEIKKKLNENYIVISDRYKESSLIYQSIQSDEITLNWVKEINTFAGEPDITIILDIDPKIALARKMQKELDKFENSSFLYKVRDLYLKRAKENNYYIVNSDDVIELVQEEIQKIIINHLNDNV